jgi:hypothetical protein
MQHHAVFDRALGVMKVKVIGGIMPQEVAEIHENVESSELESTPRFFLCDLSKARLGSLYPQETRNAIADAIKGIGYEKVAIVGEQVILKMIVKIIQKLLGDDIEAEHFNTEEEALSWFRYGVKF